MVAALVNKDKDKNKARNKQKKLLLLIVNATTPATHSDHNS